MAADTIRLKLCTSQQRSNTIDRDEILARQRQLMIDEHLKARGIVDPRVLAAMASIKRENFIPDKYLVDAYGDHPVPIGSNQTISQPYIVALMSQLCEFSGTEKVLEIGCGSGYQAAVLSRLAAEVYSIERIKTLAESSGIRLLQEGCLNVTVVHGDGYCGLPERAPFDVIIVTAAPVVIPEKLVDQLAENGRMVLPVGDSVQKLLRLTRMGGEIITEDFAYVRFVPMVKGYNL
ncbi:MAG TPA: protein-L-isoaspartate(D-aspartate) O-methyltransferase [Spirochaetota bacterium]|nr:protein-L-isoaspartate(D-aspartate) O-methyltransferase [Spirochaetota bacterium]